MEFQKKQTRPPQNGSRALYFRARQILSDSNNCYYDHYPYEADVLELSDETINAMKEAYRQIRIAEIYAERVDWMMSGDDSEECFRERIKEDLEECEKEYVTKDWTYLDEE